MVYIIWGGHSCQFCLFNITPKLLYGLWIIINKTSKSPEFPYQKANMIPIQQNTSLALVVKVRSKIDPTDHMPAPLKLLLKTFFNILSCVLQIRYLILHHLHIDILRDLKSVLLHIDLHIAKLNIRRNLNIRRHPVLGYSRPDLFLLLTLSLLGYLFFLGCHFKYNKWNYQYINVSIEFIWLISLQVLLRSVWVKIELFIRTAIVLSVITSITG